MRRRLIQAVCGLLLTVGLFSTDAPTASAQQRPIRALLVLGGVWTASADEEQAPARRAPLPGQISEAELGDMLSAIGLKPTKTEQRYDFAFKTSYRGEEWKFSMSAVLSRNGESVWVMAWLDQIPQSSAEVPRTALLRLLAANDRLGGGKFFAYIPTNKRFVMQRVLDNRDMTNKKMQEILQDLAASVADEYPRSEERRVGKECRSRWSPYH